MWHPSKVRHSEFWIIAEETFSPSYARSLGADVIMSALGSRTAVEALADGFPPGDVWEALCDVMEIPPEQRWKRDHRAKR